MRSILEVTLIAMIFSSAAALAAGNFALQTVQPPDAYEDALTFLSWLESHARDFGKCSVDFVDGNYRLCDGTEVSRQELRELLRMSPEQAIGVVRARGLKIDVLCEKQVPVPAPFHAFCSKELDQKMFSSITTLHGEYLPEQKRILIREGASVGTLIHEYLHFKEAENDKPIYGKLYKKERLKVQAALVKVMDEKIAQVKKMERKGDRTGLPLALKEFTTASELVRAMARWQDFIDERSLFLLYLRYGKELGVAEDDQVLARKNMGFVCKNPQLKQYVTESQCSL